MYVNTEYQYDISYVTWQIVHDCIRRFKAHNHIPWHTHLARLIGTRMCVCTVMTLYLWACHGVYTQIYIHWYIYSVEICTSHTPGQTLIAPNTPFIAPNTPLIALNTPPRAVFYLAGFPTKNPEEEDPRRSTWYKFFEGGPFLLGSWLGNLPHTKKTRGGGFLQSTFMDIFAFW